MKWLLGEFRELSAFAAKVYPLEVEVEDSAEVVGLLASGAFFSCGFSDVSEIPHSERLELYGSDGGIVVDQMAEPVVKLFRGRRDFAGEGIAGVRFGPNGWNPGGWHYESVLREVEDFVRSILDDRPALVDPRDCAYAIRVVEAAYESIRTGSRVSLAQGTPIA